MRNVDIAIIGSGPAGLSAALTAVESGIKNVLLLEREHEQGGILNQCIHNGFGLHTFKEELTGPEYADRYIQKVSEAGILCETGSMVLSVEASDNGNKLITVMNRKKGLYYIESKAVILAMGCRERPRGALRIPGFRPAGIFSAGTAQHYVNIEGRMPGKEIIILGSGDIGLIMARRLTLEGAKVKVVAELMPYSGGLKRNIVQCLDDFDIPLKLSHTVVDIKGKERVEGVTIAEVDESGNPIKGTEEEISCDTLLLSCGLIPENELSKKIGVSLNSVTGGPFVNESLETSIPGVFACGNVLHVHDLVDYVTEEAARAGKKAAQYVFTESQKKAIEPLEKSIELIKIVPESGVRYTVPSTIRFKHMEDTELIRFRVGKVYRNAWICVKFNETVISRLKKTMIAPGEMEQISIKKSDLTTYFSEKAREEEIQKLTITIETE